MSIHVTFLWMCQNLNLGEGWCDCHRIAIYLLLLSCSGLYELCPLVLPNYIIGIVYMVSRLRRIKHIIIIMTLWHAIKKYISLENLWSHTVDRKCTVVLVTNTRLDFFCLPHVAKTLYHDAVFIDIVRLVVIIY